MSQVLALDIGTTSVKAGVFAESGMLASAVGEYHLDHPAPDSVEIDPERWWGKVVDTTRSVLSADGVRPGAIAAIAVSSQGESVVATDASGAPLAPALVWLDNRADAEASALADAFDVHEVYRRTGIPDVNPTWTAAKLLWWRRHRPEVFARAATFGLAGDFIVRRLTGRWVTSGSLACTSLLFDITADGWWDDALTFVGVTRERLPHVVPNGSVAGTLTSDAAAQLGLRDGVRVVCAGMDQGAGAIGVGNLGEGVVSESTGGALAVQAAVRRPDGDPSCRTPVNVHAVPGWFLYCPVCQTGGMALTWFRDQLGLPASDADGYDALTALAASVPPGCDGLTMLPHLAGAFSPEYVPSARGVFSGFTLAHTRGHFARSVLESVAFMLRRNVELLADAGAPAHEIRSHGGGSRSALWNQIKADACGVPVSTMEGADAALRGDAMLAAVATGMFADLDEASRAWVRPRATFTPDPGLRGAYDDAFGRYVDLFDATRALFERPRPDQPNP